MAAKQYVTTHVSPKSTRTDFNSEKATINTTTEPERASAERAATGSRLLALSPEIRNRIFELVVLADTTLWIVTSADLDDDLSQLPGIKQVSTQTRSEILPVFLGQNTFRVYFHMGDAEQSECLAIGPLVGHDSQLKHVEISGCVGGPEECYFRLDVGGSGDGFGVTVSFGDELSKPEELCEATEFVAEECRSFIEAATVQGAVDSRNISVEDLFRVIRAGAEKQKG